MHGTDYILDLSEDPAHLKVRGGRLLIRSETGKTADIPLAEIAVLLISHPQVTFTQAVLSGLAEAGGSAVICNRDHHPSAMVLPLDHHHVQAERFQAQAAASAPTKKRLWQAMVQAKIHAQSAVLLHLHAEDFGLAPLAKKVRSGDPANVEAQAAQRYWPRLFADSKFRRRREAPDQNRHLNFGYAALRAVTARALCAAGLHPTLGLHHRNRYNAFCLADDLMEPFRPLIDLTVAQRLRHHDPTETLGPDVRFHILEPLTARYSHAGEDRTLFDWLHRTAQQLARNLCNETKAFEIPQLIPPPQKPATRASPNERRTPVRRIR